MVEVLLFKLTRIALEIIVVFALIAVYRRYKKVVRDNNLTVPTNIITICLNYLNILKGK